MTRVFSTIPALLVLLASCGSPEGGAPGDLGPTDGAAADLGAPDAGPADAAPELPPPCTPGARRCLDAETVQECQGGVWKTVDVCADTHFCAMGTCVLLEDCTPGTVSDCFSYFQQTICNPEGTGYVPMDCPEGQLCVEGLCAETDCLPGQARCADAESKQVCSDAGSWQEPEPCGDGMTCVGGKCLSACMSDPKWNNSSIGCEYWTVDLDQSDKATLFTDHTPPAESPHSVVLSNPGTASAVVNFSTLAQGIELPWTEEVIQPGETRLFTMPRMDLEGAGIFDRSVRIVSNRPLVATQFNPQDAAETYSNDSSLLLPAEMLGNEYVILGWPSQMEIAFSPYPALLGYFTVVAVEEGETEVEVSLSSPSFGIVPNAPDLPAGQTHTFTLSQYEVLQLEGVSKTMALENDMSGSRVLASKKVAVFVGHEGPLICPDEAIHLCTEVNPDGSDPGCCCLEHLEEQLWPVSAWASEYVMAKIRPRGSEDWDTYRVQAGAAGITLSTEPPIPGLHGAQLAAKGDFVQVATMESFRVTATGPIQVAQYMASMTCTQGATGDPSQVMGVGVSQYRDSYPFLVPQGYDEDWLTVVRPAGAPVTLDGETVAVDFEAIGATGWEAGYVPVSPGPHLIEAPVPFGLTQYGFYEATSYANPAGMNLAPTD